VLVQLMNCLCYSNQISQTVWDRQTFRG